MPLTRLLLSLLIHRPKWPRKHSPGLNGTKLRRIWDVFYCSGGASTLVEVYVKRASSCGPKGQDNLARGYPGLPIKTCLALKGLQGWEMHMVGIGGQSSPYGNGPFRAHSDGGINPG